VTGERRGTATRAPDRPDVKGLLRAAGLRATAPRLHLLQTLLDLHHATADELARAITDEGIAVSTVYRTLEHLERVGVVRQVALAADRRSYHVTMLADHLHLRCTRCDRVTEVDAALLTTLTSAIEDQTGFRVDTAYPVLTGVCNHCGDRVG
jgi:Fur family ferric uptake transcriptional regulator